jgi:hypothetical protein
MSIEKIERVEQELRDRTFSRWESWAQDVMEYEDELATEAADAIRALLDELSRLRKALVDVRIELIHGEGDTYERITTCKEIVERALSEREGQE